MQQHLSRRSAVAGLSAATILHWPAGAAEFSYKLASTITAEHPMIVRTMEAVQKIKEQTNGRLDIAVYPNSTLGQETALLSQAISGALQMYVLPLDVLAPRNPACGLIDIGFAFDNYDHVWAAQDGPLGDYLRGEAEKLGLFAMDKCFDHGFRVITTRNKPIVTPNDLRNFKIRLPVSPYLIALFRGLGASPVSINFGEVYSALQTGIADGQENPMIVVDTGKLYEVQKFCSVTNHIWSGLHISFNTTAWKKLPPDVQEIAHRNFTEAAMLERVDWINTTDAETQKLGGLGLAFNTPDVKPFQEALRSSGYYGEMREKAGARGWALLENAVGPLA
jgi:tripartite ATP-independent transporter DctP family solute receptor